MQGYNSKQKLYIFIAIAIFVTINLLAVVFALPYLNKGSVKGIYTDGLNESVLVDGNIEKAVKLETNKDIANNADSLYIKNLNYTLFALPQSNFKIQDLDLIKITTGIYYLETKNNLTITNNFSIQIDSNSRVVFDSEEGNIYVLKGQVEVLGKIFKPGFVVNLNSENLSSNLLDKAQFLSTNKAKEINKLLAGQSLFIPELNFLSVPQLEIKDNLLEVTTDSTTYNIEGKVSSLSHVFVDSVETKVNDDGSFRQSVDLSAGINNFQVSVVDEVANTSNVNVKIILNN